MTITTRQTDAEGVVNKNSPLTNAEVDGNFIDLHQSKAPLASPTLTGVPTAPTATSGTNTTQIATTAYVQTAVGNTPTRLQINTRSTPIDVNILNAKIIVAARAENVEIGVI